MKLLICADFQLGAGERFGTAERTRLADQADTLGRLELAAMKRLDWRAGDRVVFLGDAFQHRRPGIDELIVFDRWARATLPIMLKGNHDDRGPGTRSVLELFDFTPNAIEPDEPNAVTLPTVANVRDVGLAFMPWSHPGTLRAAREKVTPAEHADALVNVAAGLRAQLEDARVRVLFTHHALSGMSLPSGITTAELVHEPVLDVRALAAQGWDYIAAGHVHKAEALELEPGRWAVSVGSPHVCDFGEAGGRHGYWMLDTDRGELEHVPLEDRPFLTLTGEHFADVTGLGKTRRELSPRVDVEGAVVRVRLVEAPDELPHDLDELRARLYAAGAHKVYDLHVDVERAARARADVRTDTDPLKALGAWLELRLESRQGQRVRDYLSRLIEEV